MAKRSTIRNSPSGIRKYYRGVKSYLKMGGEVVMLPTPHYYSAKTCSPNIDAPVLLNGAISTKLSNL